MSKNTTMSRRNRRSQFRSANFLKIKNMFSRFSPQALAWYSKMSEDGKLAHEAHTKRTMDQIEEQLESKLKAMKETWSEMGYNAEEIAILEEAWSLSAVKDSDPAQRKLDKKQSRQLTKQAQEMRKARV